MRRSPILAALASATVALALAGCGSSGSSSGGSGSTSASSSAGSTAASSSPAGGYSSGSAATTAAKPASGGSTTVIRTASGKLGTYLVDASGRTLYLWKADRGTSSSCNGACAQAWPPLATSGKPTAGNGVTASLLGTTRRSDGTTEVTYGGHPLYTFVGDSAPGQVTGQDSKQFGAAWYVVAPSGKQIGA